MDKIYIIEDDQTIRNEIVQALKKWNFQADWVRDFQTIDYEIKQQSPDLIVMDITLPFYWDELSNQAQLFAEENFTWTFPSQDLAWTVI
ncbi:response regulator [Lactiplantibacillus argentoratensis]|nr:response regulator [Lactiplantibacillus argentoratensis]